MLDTKEMVEHLKVLACESRVAIIRLLKQGPRKVTEIAQVLDMSQPAVSQNLKILKSAKLVTDKKDGYWVNYSLNPVQLLEIRRELEGICRCKNVDCVNTLKDYQQELEAELVWVKQQLTELAQAIA